MNDITEDAHVYAVYDAISEHFDQTRYCPWVGVELFIRQLPSNIKFLDVGCGNGKYFAIRNDIYMYGCDQCKNLVNIVKNRYPYVNVDCANGLNLPYESETFQATISVAVLHHLTNTEKRMIFLRELTRVTSQGGYILITVWSTNIQDKRKNKWRFIEPYSQSSQGMDVIIPWNDKKNKIYDRYYHLFTEDEIKCLINDIPELTLKSLQYERDNIQCILQKVKTINEDPKSV